MSATRTQVYLTSQQRGRIDEIVARDGVTMAEVIRAALDRYLASAGVDASQALAQTFGAAADVSPPDRDEWSRE